MSSPRIPTSQPHPSPPHLSSPPAAPTSRTSSPAPAPTSTPPHASPSRTAPTSAPPPPPPPPRPPFSPFFTLVSSADSPSSHHPTVHYLFSDDADTDLVTSAAALQTLELASSTAAVSAVGGGGGARALPSVTSDHAPRNRFVVVDLDESGKRVVAARSMASDWQVVGAHVEPAPTWEGEGDGKGLLLRVEGVPVGRRGDEDGGEGLEALVEGYMKRLGELRRVVEGGGGGEGGVG